MQQLRRRRWRFLGPFYQDRPVFRDRHVAIQRRHVNVFRYLDRDVKLALLATPIGPARWWYVCVVPPQRGTDVPIVRQQVVGWVETHPSHLGQKSLDPGMRSVGPGPIRVLLAMVQIATHISAGYAHMPHQRNHRVGKILADTLPRFECLVDGGVYVRAAWYIVKPVIERGVEL